MTVTKVMVADPHRRITSLLSTIQIRKFVPEEHRRVLEHAARHCPVQHSLDARIQRDVNFGWAEK